MKTFEVLTENELEKINGGFTSTFIKLFLKFVKYSMSIPHGSCTPNDPRYEYNDATYVQRRPL